MNNIKNIFYLRMIVIISIVSILITIYFPIIQKLIHYLISNDDYSYGLLIPLVSAYIIYLKWPQLKKVQLRPSWWGMLVLAGGLGLAIIGELAADLYIPRLSFVISLGGILLLLGGWSFLRLLLFPLLLLILMIPLPELVTNKLTLPLQLVSSRLATFFLQILGIPVHRQGNIIDLGVRQMQVVDACSGLRYILALLALGVIFCYFYQRRPWKIIILLLILIPATIVANALRVAGMGLYPALLEGFWHLFSGWLIFVFCFLILAMVNYLLNLWRPPSAKEMPVEAAAVPAEGHEATAPAGLWLKAAIAAGVMIMFIPVAQRAASAPPYPLKQGLENFPMTIGPWQGRHVYIDPEMVAATKSSAHLNAEYIHPGEGTVGLWIAYYETQKKAGAFVHSPKGCFIASGWEIQETRVIEIAPHKPVNWMIANYGDEQLLVYYWFLQRGRWLASETQNKLYMAYDGMLRRRTDGALVRLITPIRGNLPAAHQRLTSFAQALIPELNNYIPE